MASVLVLSALVALVGCSSSSKTATTTSSSSSSSSSTSSSSSASSSTSSSSAASSATLATAANKSGQQMLVDAKGMTVYLYEPNGTSTTSMVPDGIKANWPAVTASGEPTAGTGL